MNDARSVIAIEKDPRCVMALQELIDAANGRLNVIEGDALELDLEALALPPRKIVANLPYNVGTLLLINWLKQAEKFQSLTLMFQKEVAERIIAQPGDKHYGRLSVLAHWRCHTELCFILPPKAFSPPPKVESAIIHLTPRTPAPTDCHLDDLEKVTGAAFGQRRKMLRKSLQTLDVAADHLLEKTGIDGTRRAETLEVAEFVMLAATYRTISIDKRNKTED